MLARNSGGTNYDVVDFDIDALHLTPGYSSNNPYSLNPNAASPPTPLNFATGFGAGDIKWAIGPDSDWPVGLRPVLNGGDPRRHPNARPNGDPIREQDPNPDGYPPYLEARYNYLTPAERPGIQALLQNGVIPAGTVLPALDHAPGHHHGIRGVLAHQLPAEFDEVWLTDEVWARFGAGIDIPGFGFELPDAVAVEEWAKWHRGDPQDCEYAPQDWQWRFGRDPMGLDPNRSDANGVPLPPRALTARSEAKGRHMLDDPYVEFERDKWRAELPQWTGII